MAGYAVDAAGNATGHTRGFNHVAIAQYLQQEGAATATQDKYGRTPLSYLPERAKRIGLMTPMVDGTNSIWAVEVVGRDGTTLKGSVAQSSEVRIKYLEGLL